MNKHPVQRVLPKLMVLDALFIIPGIFSIIMIPDIGLFIGIGLIVVGGILTGLGLVNAIRRSPCQECGRLCRLELPQQSRMCDVCEIEWLMPTLGGNNTKAEG